MDVAVDHVVAVRVGERVHYLARNLHYILDGELLLAVQPVAQRLPLHVGHHIIKE